MGNSTLHAGTVAVIGNGPVGQTTALLLARWGIRVILLDGRPHRDPIGSKALCQQRDILDIWESVGVGHKVADEGVSLSVSRTYHRNTELFSLSYTEQAIRRSRRSSTFRRRVPKNCSTPPLQSNRSSRCAGDTRSCGSNRMPTLCGSNARPRTERRPSTSTTA